MSDQDEPVIQTPEQLRQALAQQFFDNANTGNDDTNDDIVEALAQWKRKKRNP